MSLYQNRADERFEAAGRQILREHGVTLTFGEDFQEFKEIVTRARPDHRVGDPFDPDVSDLHKDNALWVVGRDSDGVVMHTYAIRLLPMGDMTLAEYFRAHYREFFPERETVDFSRARYKPGPGAKRIQGRVGYCGEFWVGGKPGQFRGTGITGILGPLAFLAAMRRITPNYLIGFMPRPVIYKGFGMRSGWMHAEPYAMRWYTKNSQHMLDGTMVYMSAEDIGFLVDLPITPTMSMAA